VNVHGFTTSFERRTKMKKVVMFLVALLAAGAAGFCVYKFVLKK
jgi:hypothetical protein